MAAVQEADRIAARHGLSLIVFGSLSTGRFDEASDIDLALVGESADMKEVEQDVWDAIVSHGFSCDVVALATAAPSLRSRILNDGRRPSALE